MIVMMVIVTIAAKMNDILIEFHYWKSIHLNRIIVNKKVVQIKTNVLEDKQYICKKNQA